MYVYMYIYICVLYIYCEINRVDVYTVVGRRVGRDIAPGKGEKVQMICRHFFTRYGARRIANK